MISSTESLIEYVKFLNESYIEICFNDIKFRDEIIDFLTFEDRRLLNIPAIKFKKDGHYVRFYRKNYKSIIIRYGILYFLAENYDIFKKYIPKSNDINQEELSSFINSLSIPFSLRDYQYKMVVDSLTHKKIVNISATGSGKSLSIYIIIMYLVKKLKKKGVLIVPNVNLIKQMESDFKEYGSEKNGLSIHSIYSGKEKSFNLADVTFITMSSFILLNKEQLSNLDYLIIDEAHKTPARKFNKIIFLSQNSEYKIGFTGTFPINHIDVLYLRGVFPIVNKVITARELIDKNLATDIIINVLYFKYNIDISLKYYDIYKKGLVKKKYIKNSVRYLYDNEMKFLMYLPIRYQTLGVLLHKISNKYGNTFGLYKNTEYGERILSEIMKIKTGKYLVFYNTLNISNLKKHLEEYKTLDNIMLQNSTNISKNVLKKLQEYNKDINNFYYINDYGIYIIRGDVKANQREYIRRLLEEKNNVIVIANISIMSTGINIKNLHTLFFLQPTKSYYSVIQSLGRLMRKLDDKHLVRVYDIVDDLSLGKFKNYALRHYKKRLEYYFMEKHIIKEHTLNLKEKK